MSETYQSIGEWAITTFGRGKPGPCYMKLGEEFGELARPLQKQEYNKAILEMADMIVVLSHLAASLGLDLENAVAQKMRVNRVRTWEITAEGTGRHTSESSVVAPALALGASVVGVSTVLSSSPNDQVDPPVLDEAARSKLSLVYGGQPIERALATGPESISCSGVA